MSWSGDSLQYLILAGIGIAALVGFYCASRESEVNYHETDEEKVVDKL